jgi:hypothetical protein
MDGPMARMARERKRTFGRIPFPPAVRCGWDLSGWGPDTTAWGPDARAAFWWRLEKGKRDMRCFGLAAMRFLLAFVFCFSAFPSFDSNPSGLLYFMGGVSFS